MKAAADWLTVSSGEGVGDGEVEFVVKANNGVLQAGVVMFKAGTDAVPFFTTQPQSGSANASGTVTLTAVADGKPHRPMVERAVAVTVVVMAVAARRVIGFSAR